MLLWSRYFKDDEETLLAHQAAVGRNWPTVAYIKQELSKDDPDLWGVKEAWYELSPEEQRLIWRAPTKGGCFTTLERDVIKNKLPQGN